MVGLRKHIHRPHSSNLVFLTQNLKVASLGGRIAADINHSFRRGFKYHVRNIRMDSCPRWVEDYDVRTSVFCDEIFCQNILHVSSKESTILYAVVFCVHLCVLNSLRHIFYADDLCCLARDELGYGSGPGVEVIDNLTAGECREFPCRAVEFVGLFRVGLVE